MGAASHSLLSLAEERFDTLSEAERKTVSASSTGERAICGPTSEDLNLPENDPANASGWGQERALRAELLQWLCTAATTRDLIQPFGIRVRGARVEGTLDLSFATVPVPLFFRGCSFSRGIRLVNSSLPELGLTKCFIGPLPPLPWGGASYLRAIDARGLRLMGSLLFDGGFRAEGEVRLFGAEIGGILECSAGSFKNATGRAIDAQGLKSRDVYLREGFRAEGEVRLYGAKIIGSLECDGGKLKCHAPSLRNIRLGALNAQGINISGAALFRNGFKCEGEVSLFCAKIGGDVVCDGAKFTNPRGYVLNLSQADIGGSVILGKGFVSEGQLRMFYANIHGNLQCEGSTFANIGGVAFNADGSKINGTVVLRKEQSKLARDFVANGEVRLRGANIGGSLECDGGSFMNAKGRALNVEGIKVGGSILLRNCFKASGEVRLYHADIGDNLDCDGGNFINRGKVALQIEGARIKGTVFLRKWLRDENNDFQAEGEVRLRGAKIDGGFICDGGSFKNAKYVAIDADLARVGGDLLFSENFRCEGNVRLHGTVIEGALNVLGALLDPKAEVNLSDASCAVLVDAPESWPQEAGKLVLDGFVYGRIERPGDPARRLRWLRLQVPEKGSVRGALFWPQPYRQLAAVLRMQGHDAEAKAILIGLARDRRRWADLGWASRAWQWVLWITIRNGYQPLRSLYALLILWTVGFLAFGWGYQKQVIVPTDKLAYESLKAEKALPGNYEPFCALVYAIDTALPIISLGQRDRWHPGAEPSRSGGSLLSAGSQAELQKGTQSEVHGWVYDAICRASFTQRWDPRAKWVEPATLATTLGMFRFVYIVLGWFFASMLAAGVSGLVGRE
jgi:hypothetical protein